MKNLTIDGQGSEFVFYGRMIPVSLLRSENCVLKNFSIDFEQPHIAQVQVVENDPEKGITFEPAPWVDYRISKDSVFEGLGEGWVMRYSWGIAFDGKTKHVVYNTSDIGCPTKELLKWLPAGFALQSGKMHVWCPAQWWLCVDGDVRLRAFSCHMM